MNNREWLYSLDVADLADWFDSEHDGTLDGDTTALKAQVHELQAALDSICISLSLHMATKPITPDMRKPEVLAKLIIETIKKLANEREHYRSKFSMALGYADDIHALMDDEGMA